jgi:hypothetical protein
MPPLTSVLRSTLKSPVQFIERGGKIKLRKYQLQVVRAVISSVINNKGLSFVVMFPRQSGKNEVQAQIESYLLTVYSTLNKDIVKVSPTWKPQSLNAMRRLDRVLSTNLITRSLYRKEEGFIFRIGNSRIQFFSGQPESNIVGATASALLEVDEAQDVDIQKFDRDIAPMASSTNATRVFWGTAWTDTTLLARELKSARALQRKDRQRRVFICNANQVAKEVPAYGLFVQEQVHKLGRNNPLIKTQYFSEMITSEGGMFPPARRQAMQGTHSRLDSPNPGEQYAFLIDVAGEDENATLDLDRMSNPGRDSTVLTIVRANTETLTDPIIRAPTYEVVSRRAWIGLKHSSIYATILDLAKIWMPLWMVIDSTGVGAGLSSFLVNALGQHVLPFIFTSSTKSALGWDFISLCETGRFKDHKPERGYPNLKDDRFQFWNQIDYVQMEVIPGPERKLRWGVPDGTRDISGELVHDDYVISAALASVLDQQNWITSGEPAIIHAVDPLQELSRGF